ncbi:MAG: Hsp20/alpha crystallin family protein [Porphyromonas sp.]|nr:Hsp20/alpha crystallin family protein [Porphyromonas sp.]
MGRTIFDLMDEIFANDFSRSAMNTNKRVSAPMINVLENDEAYTIQIAAPGLTKDDVLVKLDEDEALVISMQKKEEKVENEETQKEGTSDSKEIVKVENKPVRYLRREFMHQSFVQRLILPEDVDKENIGAKMENGMLEVVIPKNKVEEQTPVERLISIK